MSHVLYFWGSILNPTTTNYYYYYYKEKTPTHNKSLGIGLGAGEVESLKITAKHSPKLNEGLMLY